MVHTGASEALHHSFFLRQKTSRLLYVLHILPEAPTCLGYVHKEGTMSFSSQPHFPFWDLVPISGLGISFWDSDPGSKMLFLSLHSITHPSSIVPISTHYQLRDLQMKPDTRNFKRKEQVISKSLEIAFGAGDFPHASQSPLILVPTISTYIQGGWVKLSI